VIAQAITVTPEKHTCKINQLKFAQRPLTENKTKVYQLSSSVQKYVQDILHTLKPEPTLAQMFMYKARWPRIPGLLVLIIDFLFRQ